MEAIAASGIKELKPRENAAGEKRAAVAAALTEQGRWGRCKKEGGEQKRFGWERVDLGVCHQPFKYLHCKVQMVCVV